MDMLSRHGTVYNEQVVRGSYSIRFPPPTLQNQLWNMATGPHLVRIAVLKGMAEHGNEGNEDADEEAPFMPLQSNTGKV